jgi:hypothetical protein
MARTVCDEQLSEGVDRVVQRERCWQAISVIATSAAG